jgi:hypothetical protein
LSGNDLDGVPVFQGSRQFVPHFTGILRAIQFGDYQEQRGVRAFWNDWPRHAHFREMPKKVYRILNFQLDFAPSGRLRILGSIKIRTCLPVVNFSGQQNRQ